MRHLVLSDDGFSVAPNAYHRLLAACYFPNSVRDQQQALFIASLEQEEFNKVGGAEYVPSQIMQATAQMVQKRTARYYSVGFVTLSLIWLRLHGDTPSLNKAATMASCVANDFRGVRWWNSLDPQANERVSPVTGDVSTIERIFREYRSVAHICAASVSSASYLDATHLWDQAPEVVASMIQTCAAFQVALEDSTNVKDWNLWDVKKHFPSSLGDWPALLPDGELEGWVRHGYEAALEQGLIREPRGGLK